MARVVVTICQFEPSLVNKQISLASNTYFIFIHAIFTALFEEEKVLFCSVIVDQEWLKSLRHLPRVFDDSLIHPILIGEDYRSEFLL